MPGLYRMREPVKPSIRPGVSAGARPGNLPPMNGKTVGYDPYDPNSMDDGWIAEWVEFGLRELSVYLRRQAAFEAYYERRQPRFP